MKFIGFMASGFGRLLRIVAGLVIIGAGIALFLSGNVVAGVILIIVGLIPFLAGAFDFCLLAPLFGYPLQGTAIRQAIKRRSVSLPS